MELAAENRSWLDGFVAQHGRPPKVLHIGNVANNAYNNAKLLIEAGLCCDVICYDYYHIMGCPEWEDADFQTSPGDDFRPDWYNVDLCGFELPKWFAQGEMLDCLNYLTERCSGTSKARVSRVWERLLRGAHRKCPTVGSAGLGLHIKKPSAFLVSIGYTARRLKFVFTVCDLGWSLASLNRSLKRNSRSGWLAFGLKVLLLPPLLLAKYVLSPLMVLAACVTRRLRNGDQQDNGLPSASEIVRSYGMEFPHGRDPLGESDFVQWLAVREMWRELLRHYDIIIGYSTDPIIPMLCGVPYFAFEHGTIREIPYQPTAQGRLTSLAYRLAKHVFVTNFDCKDSADYLAPGKYSLINHPYDEDHGLTVSGVGSLRQETLARLDSDFLFFHPTRQDWVQGTGYADKQNDVFLRAFGELRQRGVRVGMVCCSWGANVEHSKKLLVELGVDSYVLWIPPQAITPFERFCMASDIVADQFMLGAFGGVVFKAMAVGAPILTFLDVERLSKQYSSPPPVINCKTQEEIVSAIDRLTVGRDELASLRRASRAWMKKFHGKALTVNAQLNQFRLNEPGLK